MRPRNIRKKDGCFKLGVRLKLSFRLWIYFLNNNRQTSIASVAHRLSSILLITAVTPHSFPTLLLNLSRASQQTHSLERGFLASSAGAGTSVVAAITTPVVVVVIVVGSLVITWRLRIVCRRLLGYRVRRLDLLGRLVLLGLSKRGLHLRIVVFKGAFEKEVGGVLLILVAR